METTHISWKEPCKFKKFKNVDDGNRCMVVDKTSVPQKSHISRLASYGLALHQSLVRPTVPHLIYKIIVKDTKIQSYRDLSMQFKFIAYNPIWSVIYVLSLFTFFTLFFICLIHFVRVLKMHLTFSHRKLKLYTTSNNRNGQQLSNVRLKIFTIVV